jgi:hypothetical protein
MSVTTVKMVSIAILHYCSSESLDPTTCCKAFSLFYLNLIIIKKCALLCFALLTTGTNSLESVAGNKFETTSSIHAMEIIMC